MSSTRVISTPTRHRARSVSRALIGTFIVCAVLVPDAQGQATGQADHGTHADSAKYWIFFTDKRSSIPASLKAQPNVSDRTQSRRKLRGSPNQPAHVDTPVSSEYVRELEQIGVESLFSSRWLNAVSAYLHGPELESINRLPFVSRVTPVGVVVPSTQNAGMGPAEGPWVPYESVAATVIASSTAPGGVMPVRDGPGLDYGPSEAQLQMINAVVPIESGIIGTGVIIGFLDTTFGNFSHPVFSDMVADNRVLATQDFAVGAQTNTHGLSVASTAVGFSEGSLIGPAYGASVLAATTEYAPSETNQEEDAFVAGLEWLESQGADVVNSSLGYSTFDAGQSSYTTADLDGDTGTTTIAFDMAAELGMVVVTSAGNEGCASPSSCWYYITMPADGDSVVAVGAVDLAGARASFSSRGPTADGRIKPDVVAPGSPVQVATNGGYGLSGGTSFAAPLVTGVVAQMLQVNPDLTPTDVLEILRSTASQWADPDNDLGWGIVDADAATTFARSLGTDSSQEETALTVRSAYPNPARDEARIVIVSTVAQDDVNVRVVDALGRTVMELPDQRVPRGRAEVSIDTRRFASGLYHVVLTTAESRTVTTLLVVR